MRSFVAACKKRGQFVGIPQRHARPDAAEGLRRWDLQPCTIANDLGLMAMAARGAVNTFRATPARR